MWCENHHREMGKKYGSSFAHIGLNMSPFKDESTHDSHTLNLYVHTRIYIYIYIYLQHPGIMKHDKFIGISTLG